MENEIVDKNDSVNDSVDWDGFLSRKRINKSEAARLLGAAPAMVTDWVKGKTEPSRKYLKRLCKIGMTAQEMFGKEAGGMLLENSVTGNDGQLSPDIYKSVEFLEGVAKAIEDLKAKGKI